MKSITAAQTPKIVKKNTVSHTRNFFRIILKNSISARLDLVRNAHLKTVEKVPPFFKLKKLTNHSFQKHIKK